MCIRDRGKIPVRLGARAAVEPVITENCKLIVENGSGEYRRELTLAEELIAPVEQGEQVGILLSLIHILLADCYVYPDAAIVHAGEAIDSRIYDGILLAADPAVCTLDAHSSKEEKYEVLLINHPQISAVTRTVDGIAGETAPLTACPAMLVFPWEDIDTREYHFTYAPAAEALLALPESSLDTAAPDSLTVPARTIWKTNSLAQITTFMMLSLIHIFTSVNARFAVCLGVDFFTRRTRGCQSSQHRGDCARPTDFARSGGLRSTGRAE